MLIRHCAAASPDIYCAFRRADAMLSLRHLRAAMPDYYATPRAATLRYTLRHATPRHY